ncbi:MAG TPA: hypothetical protein VIJ22_04980, partial [Polyangiaceae bacterium]
MHIPARDELIGEVRALPSAAPLLAAVGHEAVVHLVGGAVRDLLLRGASGRDGTTERPAGGSAGA